METVFHSFEELSKEMILKVHNTTCALKESAHFFHIAYLL